MTALTYDHAALRFAQRVSARDALRAIRHRMPAPLSAPDFDGAGLRLTALVAALIPSAALSWMFIAC